MNVLNRNRLSPSQRKIVNDEVVKGFEKVSKAYEQKVSDRVQFIWLLATALTLQEHLRFGTERREKFMDELFKRANGLSEQLCGNKCKDAEDHEDYDIEYNREILKRLSADLGIEYDESVFDDDGSMFRVYKEAE